jgi:hypothetical protein
MLLDMMSSELTYSPKAGLTMHSGLVSKKCAVGLPLIDASRVHVASILSTATAAVFASNSTNWAKVHPAACQRDTSCPQQAPPPKQDDVDSIVAEFKKLDEIDERERLYREGRALTNVHPGAFRAHTASVRDHGDSDCD